MMDDRGALAKPFQNEKVFFKMTGLYADSVFFNFAVECGKPYS